MDNKYLNKATSDVNNKTTIGFFVQTSTGTGGFHDAVWNSMAEAAKKCNVNLFIFAGGAVDSSPYNPFENNLNIVYDLVNKENIDGIIFNCTIANFIAKEKFREFCNRFSPQMPLISIVGPIQGFSDVHVDNKHGMNDVILHLINHHNFKKLAFITGTRGNPDAEDRLNAYKDILKQNNIPYDPDLVYDGEFDEDSGVAAVYSFLRERNKEIDAIIASNDAMAFGAINGLRKLGKRVPIDIAVTGFDDTEEASTYIPSLTTVRQPFDKMSNKAIEVICGMIGKKNDLKSIAIPTELIIRQSCGCFSPEIIQARIDQNDRVLKELDNMEVNNELIIDEIVKEFIASINIITKDQCKSLIKKFISDVKKESSGLFLLDVEEILHNSLELGNKVSIWQKIISNLRKYIFLLWKDEKNIFRAENIINQARVIIGEMSMQYQAYKNIVVEKQSCLLKEVGQTLFAAFDFENLKKEIRTQLPRLNIPSCFISIFEDKKKGDCFSKLFLAFNEKGNIDLNNELNEYKKFSLPNKHLLPQKRRFTYAVHPLNFENQKLGFALFELGLEEGFVYDALQTQISSSLMGTLLFYQSGKTELILKQNSDNIQKLIKPMIDSIDELTMIIKEKMEIINNLIDLTKENSKKLKSTNLSIEQMSKNILKMLDMLNIINEISIKVDMLALNVSIEAAHAGQYGKGFSIIAGEIRKLSDSIKMNTNMISNLLKDIRINLDNSHIAGNDSLKTFEKLEIDIFEIAGTLKHIENSMDKLSENSDKILSIMNL